MMVVSYCGYGQDRKLDVSFSMGAYSTPYYQKAQVGLYYAANFDYLLDTSPQDLTWQHLIIMNLPV